jgi:hypothetical protein
MKNRRKESQKELTQTLNAVTELVTKSTTKNHIFGKPLQSAINGQIECWRQRAKIQRNALI